MFPSELDENAARCLNATYEQTTSGCMIYRIQTVCFHKPKGITKLNYEGMENIITKRVLVGALLNTPVKD
jgi:hypothetical protein